MPPGSASPVRKRSTPFGAAKAALPALADTFAWHAAAEGARSSAAKSRARSVLGRWPPGSTALAGCRGHCAADTARAGRTWELDELCVVGVGFSTSTGTSRTRRGACAWPCRRAPTPEAAVAALLRGPGDLISTGTSMAARGAWTSTSTSTGTSMTLGRTPSGEWHAFTGSGDAASGDGLSLMFGLSGSFLSSTEL